MLQVNGRVQEAERTGPFDVFVRGGWTVKRAMTVLAGVAVIGVLGYVSSRLWAQAPGSQARVSVAIINLPQTLNMYDKFKAYQTEFKSKMAEFEIVVRGGDPTKKYTDKDKENAEAWITKLKRDREDLAGKIKKDF